MLNFKDRLAMFKAELAETSPDAVLAELRSYEAKGPLACEFLSVVYDFVFPIDTITVNLEKVMVSVEKHNADYRCDDFYESFAEAA